MSGRLHAATSPHDMDLPCLHLHNELWVTQRALGKIKVKRLSAAWQLVEADVPHLTCRVCQCMKSLNAGSVQAGTSL